MDRLLRNTTVLRILALVLSCILWLFVNAPPSNSTAATAAVAENFPFSVHVEVGSNMVASVIKPASVSLVVKGSALNLSSLPAQLENTVVFANAMALAPGKYKLPLYASNLPQNLTPSEYSFEPSTVTVLVERKQNADRSVSVVVQGHPALGYTAGIPTSDVQEVQLSGPAENVNQVKQVLAMVSVDGATQNVEKAVKLSPVDAQGNVVPDIEIDPKLITVLVPVESPQFSVTAVPQISGSPAPGYSVSNVVISPPSMTVFSLPNQQMSFRNVSIPVDVTGFKSNRTVQVEIPLGPGVERIEPKTVTVTVTVEPSLTRTFGSVPILTQNTPAGEKVTLTSSTNTVSVTVTGPKSVVAAMSASDINAFVDASSLVPGATQAQVNVILPDWVQATQVSLYQVPVQVTSLGTP